MAVNDFDENGPAAAQPHEHVLFTDLDGVEGVLVDLNTKKYYQLNETASLVWRGLEKGMPLSSIAQEIIERYDVTIEHATESVERAVGNFAAQKLLRRV